MCNVEGLLELIEQMNSPLGMKLKNTATITHVWRIARMRPLSLKEIATVLQGRLDELRRDYGVREIGVFGSCVRNEATEGSDIDILVEFNRPVGFFKFLELEERLGELLGAKVDLVTKAALKPYIGRRILDEVVRL